MEPCNHRFFVPEKGITLKWAEDQCWKCLTDKLNAALKERDEWKEKAENAAIVALDAAEKGLIQ